MNKETISITKEEMKNYTSLIIYKIVLSALYPPQPQRLFLEKFPL